MSNFRKSIALTLGAAIASSGLCFSLASYAQGGTGTTSSPAPSGTTSSPAPSGTMSSPAPSGTMSSPAPSGTMSPAPSGTMTKPSGTMTKPSGTMTKPSGTMTKPSGTMTSTQNIVEVAASDKSFTILVKALKEAGLVKTLSEAGPYTVFAPTNAAFNKLPKATLAKLLKPQNKALLVKILTYHVVNGDVTSNLLRSGKIGTLEGGKLNVKVSGKQVNVNAAKVIKADIKTSNGVIHVIDKVLIPPKLL